VLPSPLTCHAPQCAEHGGGGGGGGGPDAAPGKSRKKHTHTQGGPTGEKRWKASKGGKAGSGTQAGGRWLEIRVLEVLARFFFLLISISTAFFLSCTLHCTVWAAPALLVLCSVVPPVNMTPPKGTNTVKTPQKKGQCRSSLAKGKCELESGDVEWTTGVAYLCPGHYAA
jgi:hypothetical protein